MAPQERWTAGDALGGGLHHLGPGILSLRAGQVRDPSQGVQLEVNGITLVLNTSLYI